MEILPNIEIVDLGLYLKKEKILAVSDFHLGYEEGMKEKGFLVPKFQLKDILIRLESILKKVKIEKIVINGDLKHEYGKILGQEWKDVLKLFDFLSDYCKEIVIVKGNHDLFLGPVAWKRGLKIVEKHPVGDKLICHGHEMMQSAAKVLIIGHEHPAIVLEAEGKREKFKCFLAGKSKGKEIIVMPSFNPLSEGTDILKRKLLSPYLEDISEFKVYAAGEGRAFDFGKVKELAKTKFLSK